MPDKPVLTIAHAEAVAPAAEIERLSGQPVAAFVVEALRNQAESLRPKGRPIDWDRLRQIQARVRSRPSVDDRPADEIIGYNQHGHFD